ncbi:MAG: hypothetical protein LH478_01235 [Chitinophagaceae bacterium]|nr:hypothetical protein [Chitinophagaceae bacterium]
MKAIIQSCLSMALIVSMAGCEKEANRKLLDGYFKYDAGGATINITQGILLNENIFTCTLTGDTALQIMTTKIYDGAGFYIKNLEGIKEGTYALNDGDKGYYLHPKDFKKYATTATKTGSLTIKRGTFQAKTLINVMEGTFNFTAADSVTGKQVQILNGSFLMELKTQ